MPRSLSPVRSRLVWLAAIALLASSTAAPGASAATLGQVDDFANGAAQVAINPIRLAGNYLTQKVLGISANPINPGASDLSPRPSLADPASEPPTSSAVSIQAISSPSGSGSMNVVFATTAGAFIASNDSAANALAAFREVRNLQNLTAAFPGEVIAAPFSICNPSPIPEPGTGLLLGLGLVALAARRRRP